RRVAGDRGPNLRRRRSSAAGCHGPHLDAAAEGRLMAATCREQIVAAVVARLEVITGVPGLAVERDREQPITAAELPRLIVYEGAEDPVALFLGEDCFDLRLVIEGGAAGETASLAASASALLRGKVEQAILADVTLGGLARDIQSDGEEPPEALDFTS